MDNTSNHKDSVSSNNDTKMPCTSQVTPASPTEHVVQFEFDELTSSDTIDSMLLPPSQSNGGNSLRSSLVGYFDAECFRSLSEQLPDEALTKTRLHERPMTDLITQVPRRASRQSSIDQSFLDMLFNSSDLVPFYLESECDLLHITDEDDIVFQSGSSAHAGTSCKNVGIDLMIAPMPIFDETIYKSQIVHDFPKEKPELASRQSSIDTYLLDVLLDLDTNQPAEDATSSFHKTNMETEAIKDDIVPTTPQVLEDSPPSKKQRRLPQSPMERIYVGTESLDTDVVCGRGEWVNRHPGHQLFHHEKTLLQSRYSRVGVRRKEKTVIAQELVNAMQEKYNSRFLDFCKVAGQWYIISPERALEKAKQVLREASYTSVDRKEKRQRYKKPRP